MVRSHATTAAQYLHELPDKRRAVISAVRKVVRDNLPAGYREAVNWGMLSYEIPLQRYPETYNGQPLSYVGLAAQKNHYALYLMCVNCCPKREAALRDAFQQAGKKLDMGKACLRFRKLEDLPLDVIGQAVASVTPDEYIAIYEASRRK